MLRFMAFLYLLLDLPEYSERDFGDDISKKVERGCTWRSCEKSREVEHLTKRVAIRIFTSLCTDRHRH